MERVSGKNNTFDSVECGTSELWQGVDSRCCTLRVALEDEALSWVASKTIVDMVDDLTMLVTTLIESRTYIDGCSGRVLVSSGGIDCVVLALVREVEHG